VTPFARELRDGGLDVVAVERDVVGARVLAGVHARAGRVDAHVRLRQVEDQPAVADVGGREAQHVADERPERLRLRRVEHRVDALDHGDSRFALRPV
jgi:hypothetical protein